jgi:hypothetical protein
VGDVEENLDIEPAPEPTTEPSEPWAVEETPETEAS